MFGARQHDPGRDGGPRSRPGSLRRSVTALAMFTTALAVFTTVLAACGSADEPTATRGSATRTQPDRIGTLPPTPATLSFFADYSRYLWHTRRLVIATTNHGTEPIEVSAIALRTGHFESLPAESKRSVIAPGARVDLQVDFGELVSCDHDPVRPANVEITFASGSGPPTAAVATVDPEPLDAIRRRECAQRRVTEAADIGFGPAFEVVDSAAHSLTLETTVDIERRTATDEIRIDSLRGSVIIALAPTTDAEPVAVISTGTDQRSIPVQLFVARCEPHAVSQSTRTWVLSAFVSVAGAPTHQLTLAVPDEMHTALQSMIDECVATLAIAD